MKPFFLTLIFVPCSIVTYACTTCNKQLRAAISDSAVYPNLPVMLASFIVLALIVAVLTVYATKNYPIRQKADPRLKAFPLIPLTCAAMVLGLGIGGFIDGIAFHQILQWHELLTARIPADSLLHKSVNMFWDGLFHAFTLCITIVGICLLWKIAQNTHVNRSGKVLAGGMLMGWGLFNLVEGIINHHILNLHNVNELSSNRTAWNYSFLSLGALFIALGWILVKRGGRPSGTFSQYAVNFEE